MAAYILRRFLDAILLLLILSVVIFLVMRLLPGDPVLMLITGDELAQTSEEKLTQLRHEFGLDKPLAVQYVTWLGGLLRGDMGTSIIHRDKVGHEIVRRIPITLHLGLAAFILGSFLGVVLGIVSAVRRGGWTDAVVTFLANLGVAAPPFWLAALLIYLFGVHLKVLPVSGYTSPFTELRMIHGRDLSPVKVDQGQFEQVVVNLAVNARDAMPRGGILTIRTSNVTNAELISRGVEEMPPGDYVLIEVGDTGTGIPKADIDRIFEPFYSTKEVGAGTGLGLSTVHGIVKQAEGYIFVDSVVGAGTKFSIFLPRHQATASEIQAAEAAPVLPGDLTGTGTVLLVEDEDAVRLFSARALRNKGYKVLEAKGGETAIELIKALPEPVDLVITDIVMPDMDGPALVEWVRERDPNMRVICISGYAEETFRKRLSAAPDIHFLPKPFSLEQLAAKVKDVMRTLH